MPAGYGWRAETGRGTVGLELVGEYLKPTASHGRWRTAQSLTMGAIMEYARAIGATIRVA